MILFESDHYLAVEKPSGVSLATPRGSREVLDIKRFLEACGAAGRATAGEILLLHRLDVGTSGIVLLAKGAEAHRRASRLFQDRKIAKTYRAIAWGHPVPARGRLEAPLAIDRGDRRKMKVAPHGKSAVTEYRTLRRCCAIAHLELSPLTGRTHQIRVHLAERGHPILGDDLYGGARWRGVRDPALRRILAEVSRLFLHAFRLEFEEPFSGSLVRIDSPEPAAFAAVLRAADAAKARLSR